MENKTVKELREYAKENNISIPAKITKKADIIDHINKSTIDTQETLQSKTVKELREHAKENNISIPSKITRKADLIEYINKSKINKKVYSENFLNRDILQLIALESNYNELRNLCKSGGIFNIICNDKSFHELIRGMATSLLKQRSSAYHCL